MILEGAKGVRQGRSIGLYRSFKAMLLNKENSFVPFGKPEIL